jgi:DNA-binding NarL/FixJ family response regulator
MNMRVPGPPDLRTLQTKSEYMERVIKLAIIEDIDDVRNSLIGYLDKDPQIECVCAAGSMESFLERSGLIPPPDIILSDIGLPGMNGIAGIREIRKIFPEAQIIMLTIFSNSDKIFQAICAGASGYLLKTTPLSETRKAILDVSEGGSSMSPVIARKVFEHFSRPGHRGSEGETLSPREKQIVQALTDGLSYKLVADRLSISLHTVRFHIRHIYRKLHVNSKAEVIRKMMGRDDSY